MSCLDGLDEERRMIGKAQGARARSKERLSFAPSGSEEIPSLFDRASLAARSTSALRCSHYQF
jgi:hypothetical protein